MSKSLLYDMVYFTQIATANCEKIKKKEDIKMTVSKTAKVYELIDKKAGSNEAMQGILRRFWISVYPHDRRRGNFHALRSDGK